MKNSFLKCALVAAVLAWATPQTSQAGWIKRYVYNDINGTLVTNLYGTNIYGTVVFPDTPNSVERLPQAYTGPFETEFVPDSFYDNFGTWTPGYLEPPETGNYTFWVFGDDETQLWITTDAADPLNKTKRQLVATVPGWSSIREWGKYPEQQSAPVYLEKGKQYYWEVLHKEGGGGDAIGWGWQLPSGKIERPMQTFYFQPTLDTADPTPVSGPYAAPIAPQSIYDFNIYDGMEVMLFADLNLTPPYTVQWRRETTDIPGATQTYYRFRARSSDSGANFYVRVNGTLYGPLTLAVYADVVKPEVVSAALAPNNPTQIQVVFSEEVTAASATSTGSYNLNAGTVQGATLQGDGRTVLLKTSLLQPGTLHTLTISGIQDMALPPNTIVSTSTNFIIADGAISFRSWGFSRPDSLSTLRAWSHAGSTALSYVNNKFIEERVITNTSYQWNLVPARENFNSQMIGYLTPPETGYYKFAVASDDNSILYLGTSDQRSSKREICYYDGSTGRWNTGQQLANQQSALIWLEAGKAYYLEAVVRDGTGGDGVSVFWQRPSGPPLPTANASTQTATEPFLIPVQYLSTFATPPVPGGISFRIWDTLPTDLASLRTWSTNNSVAPSYTNDLFVEERTITTTSYQWDHIPLENLCTAHIIGYLTAPETGNYMFAIASDDHSVLYLGTTDQRSSKREICNYNGSTGRWNVGAQGNQRSALIALTAGKRYYFEAVYRDGTGGDGVSVFWQTPSGTVLPAVNESVQANTEPFLIPARYLSTFNTFGNVFLKTNLAATFSAAESTRPTLSVVADGTQPYAYTWYKNGAVIPGAAAASFTPPYLRPADNNAQFAVVVSNNFSSVTSAVATLTVTSDAVKPTVASVGSLFKQVVEVRLSEPVTPASATSLANYVVLSSAGTPVAVTSAVQDPNDATHVTLQTAGLPETDLMRLVVQNLADLSPAANVMNPQTNTFRANNFDALERINNSQAYSATAVGDQVLMTAGGGDIWDNNDRCAFLYKTVTGNFDYKVQGVSLPAVNSWCKMGPMARASTATGSRNVFNPFTPLTPGQNTYSAQVRDTTGAISTSSNDAGTPLNLGVQGGVAARPTILPYPSWTRIQRIGNSFYYYYSANGTNWTFWTWYDSAASTDGALPGILQVGLALTSHDTARTVDGVMASFTAVSDGALYFTLQPTNATVVEGSSTNLYVAVGGSTPWYYQWLKNTTPIPDATNATLALTRVPFADNGALIACRVSNPYGQTITTTNALLTVTKDAFAPTVRYYITPKININPTEVRLLFSEWMSPATAQNTANYQITTSPGNVPLAISGAVLDVDERTLILTTAAQTVGTLYKVVVNNVTDLACCPPNSVAPNSTDYFFYAGVVAPQFKQRADGYIIMEAENAQENTAATDGDQFIFTSTNSAGGGFSGAGYMFVPNGRGGSAALGTSPNLSRNAAKLVYYINFTQAGRHIVWIRGWNQNPADAGNDDSVHVAFNNTVGVADATADYLVAMNATTGDSLLQSYPGTGWSWRSDRASGTDPLTFTNTAAGLHRFILWHNDDGTLVDKIVIEAGNRAAGNTAAPAPCTAYGGLGEGETWDWIVAPPAGPTIAISSPTNNQAFPGNGTIPIATTTTGPTPIVLVEFFQGTNLLGTATAAPFSLDWDSVPEGIYTLTARATDGLGYQATSAAVQVIVDSTKPVAYATGSLQGTGIGVYFSDLSGLDAVSATTPANYKVNGGAITVTGATLEPDLLAVMLSLSAPVSGAFSVEVKNVGDRGFGPNMVNTVTLQSTVVTWPFNQDVGTINATPPPAFTDPVMPGFAQAIGTDGFYVHAGGHDIWDSADGMHFVHQSLTGDFDVAVRVAGLRAANTWSKAGLMVRQNLSGGSRNYLIASAPTAGQNLITMQWRPTNDVASLSIAAASRPTPTPIPNAWLRVTRTNQNFAFYWGTDGTQWVSLYTTNEVATPYPAEVYVGLAATSHDNGLNLANTTGAYYRDLRGLKVIALPELTIALNGTDVAISWTSSVATLQLQSTESLAPANWQPAGGTLVVNGTTSTVTVQLGAQPRFFRLVKP